MKRLEQPVFRPADQVKLDRSGFSARRAADVRFELPLARLKPGPHLVSFEATRGSSAASRHVVLEIK